MLDTWKSRSISDHLCHHSLNILLPARHKKSNLTREKIFIFTPVSLQKYHEALVPLTTTHVSLMLLNTLFMFYIVQILGLMVSLTTGHTEQPHTHQPNVTWPVFLAPCRSWPRPVGTEPASVHGNPEHALYHAWHIMDFLALGPNNFYLLNHHLLNRFFDILDLLTLVAINQHDLTQEQTFLSLFWTFNKRRAGPLQRIPQSPMMINCSVSEHILRVRLEIVFCLMCCLMCCWMATKLWHVTFKCPMYIPWTRHHLYILTWVML